MTLVDRLVTDLHYPHLTDEHSLHSFSAQTAHAVIFLPANPQQYPETLDVAIVLPELMKVFALQLQPAVASPDLAKTLAARYAISEWPALLFLRNGEYLGVITRMRDWDVYLRKVQELLQAPTPVKAPGIGIPVVGI